MRGIGNPIGVKVLPNYHIVQNCVVLQAKHTSSYCAASATLLRQGLPPTLHSRWEAEAIAVHWLRNWASNGIFVYATNTEVLGSNLNHTTLSRDDSRDKTNAGALSAVLTLHCRHAEQVSDKCPPPDLVSMIRAFNPDNLPGRLAVVVRMGASKLRAHLPALIEAVEEAKLVRMQQEHV